MEKKVDNPIFLKNLFYVCMITSSVFIAFDIALFVYKLRKEKISGTDYASDENVGQVDLIKYPEQNIVRPFVPVCFSIIGLFSFFLVFGIGGLVSLSANVAFVPMIAISIFLGIAGEVAASMIKYAVELQTRKDIIFVPKSIGLIGKVFKDIPAGEEGEGAIRVFMNGSVTHIRALSVDEVVLTKGTDIKILYASSDAVVVVERLKKAANQL